jgi:hypothetical protein
MKKRRIALWIGNLIVVFIGISLLLRFIELIAPHLTPNETASACLIGSAAIICLSVMGGQISWLVMELFGIRTDLKIGRVSRDEA